MEILNLKKRVKHLAVLCSVVLILLFVALSPLVSRGIVAFADNSTDIGSGGGYIEISDVTDKKLMVSNTFTSAEVGRKLKITMPLKTVAVYFAYELDTSEQIYAVSGEADIDKDIPYLLHVGKVEKNEVDTKTLGKVYSSWTDVTILNDKKVFYLDIYFNGTLYVECSIEGESNRLSSSALVKDVDCLAPQLKKAPTAGGLVNEFNQAVFECRATFEDVLAGSILSSARSGVGEIWIFRTDESIENLTLENVEAMFKETVKKWPGENDIGSVLPTQEVIFKIEKPGYYYYQVKDRVGNFIIGDLLGGKFSYDNRFDITDTSAGSSGVTYSVKDYMISIGDELGKYKDEVTSSVYDKAVEAYSTILLRFYAGESQTNREGISKAWFSFFNNEYANFRNAFSVGATYNTTTLNGDLMGNASVKGLNLNADTIPTLGGDQVLAHFIIANYAGDKLDEELLTLLGNVDNPKAYKLNYTLTVNGVQATVPKSALVYEIVGLPQNVTNFKIYLKTQSGYVECEQLSGENWLRFATTLNGGEFYLLYEDNVKTSGDLLPLWITLGVVGGLLIVGGVVVLVLWKKGIIKPRAKNEDSQA